MASDFDIFLQHQHANATSEHALVSFISETGVVLLTYVLLYTFFDNVELAIWAGIAAANSVLGWMLNRRYHSAIEKYGYSRTRLLTVINTFSVGFVWGLVPVFFFAPDNTLYIVFIVCIYAGYVSGALSVTFASTLNFLVFSLGTTLPIVARLFYEGGELYGTIGWMMIFYVSMLIYVSRNLTQLFYNSAKSQFNNIKLVEELADEKDAVEQAVASKDRFLASASHDLRQPLNAIGLFVDALRPLQTKPLGIEVIDKIRISLKGLNRMLHSLLDVSRLDANAVDYLPKHFSLNTLVAQLVSEYQAKAKHIEIVCDIHNEHTVFADPTLLHRIVRNLLDNAIKYTTKGEVRIYIAANELIDLHIEDTGIGIPADKMDAVFNEFEQLGNPERNRDNGLGLGLAIVKRLCNISNIELSMDSKVGRGTCVRLKIPVGVSSEIQSARFQSELDLNGKLAIVIDDEKPILEGMQHLITSWGCDVLIAESKRSALYMLSQQSRIPDFIISDLRLKNSLQGTDAIDAIREEYNCEIPAILLTGDTAPDRINQAKGSGLTVLYKPVDVDELRKQVETELI